MVDEDELIADIMDNRRQHMNKSVRPGSLSNYRKQMEREFSGKYADKDKKFLPRGSAANLMSRSMVG